jgi:hypothetical protein
MIGTKLIPATLESNRFLKEQLGLNCIVGAGYERVIQARRFGGTAANGMDRLLPGAG